MLYVTSTFWCKDNKKQGKRYTLPILFSYLGVNLRIIITITYFTSIIYAEKLSSCLCYKTKNSPIFTDQGDENFYVTL